MKKWAIAVYFILISFISVYGQAIHGVINTYTAVTNISLSNVTVISSGGFTVGDKVMIIEMQGASIVETNTSNFGNITSYGNAGNYEFDTISSITGNLISFTHNLCRTYDAGGNVQLISVPVYSDPTVVATLNCQPWNGSTGGVLVFQVTGTLTMNSNIDVSNSGFRGGDFQSNPGNFSCTDANYYSNAAPGTGDGGQKGESIAVYIPNEDGSQAKQANGGGGGNPGNSGGGGGGNYTAGGNGGYEYSGCSNYNTIFGQGGLALSNAGNKIFMGGGGGGGYADNGRPVTAGGNGGAIVYIIANTIVGNSNTIVDTGQAVTGIASDESSGGGGAGGSVLLNVSNYNTSITVNNSGGYGGSGDNLIFASACHGPGGGGGAGLFWISGNTVPTNITLIDTVGAPGVMLNPSSSCYEQSFGATSGASNGVAVTNLPAIPTLPSVNIGKNTTICAGTSIQLNATDTFSSYLWQNGSSGDSISVDSSGTYYVTVTNSSGCTASDTVKIKVEKPISFGLGGSDTTTSSKSDSLSGGISDTTICPGKQLILAAPAGYSSYLWQDNSIDSTFTTSVAGKYYVTITDSFGCRGSDTILVALYPKPVVNIGNDTTLCPGNAVVLNAKGGFVTYLWQNGSTDSTITVSTLGQYKIIVTDSNGCIASDSVQITACKAAIQFPDAFLPGSNGQNAIFQGYGNSIVTYDLKIFNRWGVVIFETNDITNGWDGRYNGALEPVGVYVYEAQYTGVTGGTQVAKGNVTLLR